MPTLVSMAYKFGRSADDLPEERSVVHGKLHAHDVRFRRARNIRSTTLVRALDRSSSCTQITSRTPRPRRCVCAAIRHQPVRRDRGAAVACLWGPAHGGANEAALSMLLDIQKNGGVEKIGEFITAVKDKNSTCV